MAWTDLHTTTLQGRALQRATDGFTTRREADWQRRNAQHYLFALQQHPERAALIDAEYERTTREGSGFRHIHAGSSNEPPLYGRLTTNEGIAVERNVKRLRRRATLKRTRRRRSRSMTAVEADVLMYLVSLAQTYDHVTPSYDAIAAGTGAGRRSVARAVASLAKAGRILVKRHWTSRPGPFQPSARQVANSYQILVDKIEQETRTKWASANECQLGTVKNP